MTWRMPQRAGLALALLLAAPATAQQVVSDEEMRIARNIATMLQSARAVISDKQALINDPSGHDKGLTGEIVLAEALARYRAASGSDPMQLDATSYEGRLMRAQMDAVAAVIDQNQQTINAADIGFKGFIPATFARLVNEEFGRRVGEEASVKVTAPPDLVRNRQSRPDAWEVAAIRDYLDTSDWPRGQVHSGIDQSGSGRQVRIMVPEYYSQSCLSCHGGPAGEVDITGYPKEGATEGDLGGVISIRLSPR